MQNKKLINSDTCSLKNKKLLIKVAQLQIIPTKIQGQNQKKLLLLKRIQISITPKQSKLAIKSSFIHNPQIKQHIFLI